MGAVVGGALGLAQFALTGGAPPTPPNTNAGQTPPGPPPDPAGGVQNPPLGSTNSPGSAAITAGGPYAGFALQVAGRAALSAPFTFLTEAVIVDSASGILDLGYGPQILHHHQQEREQLVRMRLLELSSCAFDPAGPLALATNGKFTILISTMRTILVSVNQFR